MRFRIPRRIALSLAGIIFTAIAIVFGVWSNRAHRQHRATMAFYTAGAEIEYSDGLESDFDDFDNRFSRDYTGDTWNRRPWIDPAPDSHLRDFFADVVGLECGGSDFSDFELHFLPHVPKLERLKLPYTNITSRGIAYVQFCPQLKYLSLPHTPIDNTCISYITRLKKLEYLDIRETQVDEAGIFELRSMSSLRRLYIDKLEIHPLTLDELKHLMPDCYISWSPNDLDRGAKGDKLRGKRQ